MAHASRWTKNTMAEQMPGGPFFQSWEPVPANCGPPVDAGLAQRIAKLSQFAAKNGPPFVKMLQEKQQNNPEYSFLNGGPGGDYFRWRLYCAIYNLDPTQGLQLASWQMAPHQFQQPGPPPVASHSPFSNLQELEQTSAQVPPEIDAEFTRILSGLNSTRASIKESKEWFMGRAEYAPGLAARMALHQQRLPTYDQQICIIYLANDVLLKSLNQRAEGAEPGSDAIAAAFRLALPVMLHTAFLSGQSSPEVHQRLTTILDHWAARLVYPLEVVAFMKQAMVQSPERAILPDPQPAFAPAPQNQVPANPGTRWAPDHAAQTQDQTWNGAVGPAQPLSHLFPQQPIPQPAGVRWSGPPDQSGAVPSYIQPGDQQGLQGMAPMGFINQQPFVPPTHMGLGGTMHQGVLPPQGILPGMPPWPGGPPIVEEPQLDPMSFPPGLLPSLVKEHLRTEEKYHPLEKKDVISAGIPELEPIDAYLAARLEKFAAELRDYRSGTSRADLEEDEKRQKTRSNLGEKGAGRYGRATNEEKPKYEDGSFKGEKRDGGPAGLGFGVVPEEHPDDPFSQYRKKRSGYYHDSLSRAQAAAEAKIQAAG